MKRAQGAGQLPSVWLVIGGTFTVNAWIAALYGQRLLAVLALVTALSALWAAWPVGGGRNPPTYL